MRCLRKLFVTTLVVFVFFPGVVMAYDNPVERNSVPTYWLELCEGWLNQSEEEAQNFYNSEFKNLRVPSFGWGFKAWWFQIQNYVAENKRAQLLRWFAFIGTSPYAYKYVDGNTIGAFRRHGKRKWVWHRVSFDSEGSDIRVFYMYTGR